MSKQAHLEEVNLVRAIAIIGVLLVHSTSSAVGQAVNTAWLPLYNFVNIFFKFGTPTFIFLSSFVLFYNYFHRPMKLAAMLRFYKNRLLYILIPYVSFSAIYFIIKNHHRFAVDAKSYTLNKFLDLLLWGNAHPHLYFVFISIQFYLLFPLLLYFFQKVRFARWTAVPLGFAIQWGFIFLNSHYFKIVAKGSISLSYMAYFFLGVFIGIYFNRIKDWIIISKKHIFTLKGVSWLILWGLWLVAAYFYVDLWYGTRATGAWKHNLYYESYWNLFTFTSALVLFQLAFLIYKYAARFIVRIMLHLASVSFGVYLLHPVVLHYYRMTQTAKAGLEFHLWVAGGFLLALLLSWGVVAAARYLPLSWMLFGNAPRRKPKPAAPVSTAVEDRGASV